MVAEKRRGWTVIVFAVAALSAFATLAVADDEADKELKQFEGTWKFVRLTADGQDAPKAFLDRANWMIHGKELTIPGPGAAKIELKLDPSKSPKQIDMTGTDGPGKGKTIKGIYRFEEGKLTICVPGGKKQPPPDAPRPEEFGGDQGRSMIVLEKSDAE